MAITEDTANQPGQKTWAGAWTSAQTTASFSPQANTLLVALVSADGGATAVTAAVTDSLGGTWTMLRRANLATTAFGTAEVWCRYLSSAPGSMTVSVARATGTSANGGQLVVRSLLGAASTQNGATGIVTRDSAGTIQASVAAGTGSWIYGAAYNWSNSTAMTVLGNTTSIFAFSDATNGDNWAAFKSSSATAGTATYGYSTSVQGALAAVEILAASGTNATATPAVVAGATSVPTPVVRQDQAITPGVVAAATAVPTPALRRDAAPAAAVVAGATTVPTPVVRQDRTVSPGVVACTTAVPTPGVTGSGGSTQHTGFADGDSTGLTYDADTGAYTLWTAFYANGRADASAAGVRIYVASGSGAGGAGFTGRLAIQTGGGTGPPDTLLEAKAFGTVATDAWTAVMFDTAHLMPDAVLGVFTRYWVGVDIPAGHYSYKSAVFGSPIVFHDLSGVWLASNAETTPGNASFGAGSGGQFPSGPASSNGWYGIDPIVTTPGGGDATATPSVVAGVVTVPTPAVTATSNASASPSSVAGATTIPAPAVTTASNAATSPAVVACTAAVPTPAVTAAGNATTSPGVVSCTTTVPTPGVTAVSNAAPAPGVVSCSTTVPTPTVGAVTNVTPAVVACAATIPLMTGQTSSTETASVVACSTTIPTPGVTTSGNASVSPGVVSCSTTVPAPGVTATRSATATPSVVAGASTVPTPGVTAGGSTTVTAVVVTCTASVPTPGVSAASNAAPHPGVVSAVTVVPAVTVSIGGGAAITTTAVACTASVPTPAVRQGQTVQATVVACSTLVPLPQFAAIPVIVTGSDRPTTAVSGSDRPTARITSTDRPTATVTSG